MFENFFESYYKLVFKKNRKMKSKKVLLDPINRTNIVGFVLFGLLAIFGSMCQNISASGISFVLMIGFFASQKLYQLDQRKKKEKMPDDQVERYREENIWPLKNILKSNGYYSLNYVSWLIEGCQLELQKKSKLQRIKDIFLPVWKCIKFVAWLLGIFIISILLNIFEISGGESIYEKVMLLVIEILLIDLYYIKAEISS